MVVMYGAEVPSPASAGSQVSPPSFVFRIPLQDERARYRRDQEGLAPHLAHKSLNSFRSQLGELSHGLGARQDVSHLVQHVCSDTRSG